MKLSLSSITVPFKPYHLKTFTETNQTNNNFDPQHVASYL